jgi:hypothetical protein
MTPNGYTVVMRLVFLIMAVALAQTARAEDAETLTAVEIVQRARQTIVTKVRSVQIMGRFESSVTFTDPTEPDTESKGQFIGV